MCAKIIISALVGKEYITHTVLQEVKCMLINGDLRNQTQITLIN